MLSSKKGCECDEEKKKCECLSQPILDEDGNCTLEEDVGDFEDLRSFDELHHEERGDLLDDHG